MPFERADPPHGFRRSDYRRHGHRWILSGMLLVPSIVLGGFALNLGPGQDPIPVDQRLAYAALCLPWIVLALRMFRVSVVPTRRALVVRNVTRTKHVPWGEVERFELGAWGAFRAAPYGSATAEASPPRRSTRHTRPRPGSTPSCRASYES